MSRRSILPHSRRHVVIYNEDWDFIEQNFCSDNKQTPGVLIREMVHKRIMTLREKANTAVSRVLLPSASAKEIDPND